MNIIEKKLNELHPYENNPRRNDDAVAYVANSISEFGFKVPLVIDKDGVIVCGHTRYKAAKQLKLKTVPCIIADDLTEEQIKAFRLADNKVSEKAEWDYELLDAEIEDIDIDLEDFGFEIYDPDEEKEKNAEKTQSRVENIENLLYGQYKGEGRYDIPILKPVKSLPPIREWIGFNYVLSDDNPEGKAVHFFVDDYQFERVWNDPEKYLEKLSQYVCVATPDFSPYGDMPNALQIYNHYRKHWVGAYWQAHGITVIPTIRASTDERSLEWYLDGEPHNGIVMISSMWTGNKEAAEKSRIVYDKMQSTLNPCKVFCYGSETDIFTGNIEYIKNFTQNRWE